MNKIKYLSLSLRLGLEVESLKVVMKYGGGAVLFKVGNSYSTKQECLTCAHSELITISICIVSPFMRNRMVLKMVSGGSCSTPNPSLPDSETYNATSSNRGLRLVGRAPVCVFCTLGKNTKKPLFHPP